MQALVDAIKSGDPEKVRELLRSDPSLAQAKKNDVSFLLLCLYAGKPELADELCERLRVAFNSIRSHRHDELPAERGAQIRPFDGNARKIDGGSFVEPLNSPPECFLRY